MFYICVIDKGGKSGTCPDMHYYQSQKHLIKNDKLLSNEEIDNLLSIISKTRLSPKVIGCWIDGEHEFLESVVDYQEVMERVKKAEEK